MQAIPSWSALPSLRYLSVNSANPYNYFNFLLDRGDKPFTKDSLNLESKKLINYFFLGLTLPSESLWVNLRPDEPGKITSDELSSTDLGRILLEEDLRLKKDGAAYLNPNNPKGKEFWEKLYAAIGKDKLRRTGITTSNRIWIVPDEAVVMETEDGAFVASAKLKVLLENDYLKANPKDATQALTEKLMKEIILPCLAKDVNTSSTYAPVRQIYYSLILAEWYKRKHKTSNDAYSSYINKGSTKGLESELPWSKQKIWQDYLVSYQKGEYNLKSDLFGLKRMYFSGGMDFVQLGSSPMIKLSSLAELTNLKESLPTNPEANKEKFNLYVITNQNTKNPLQIIEGINSKAVEDHMLPVLKTGKGIIGITTEAAQLILPKREEALQSEFGSSAIQPEKTGASSTIFASQTELLSNEQLTDRIDQAIKRFPAIRYTNLTPRQIVESLLTNDMFSPDRKRAVEDTLENILVIPTMPTSDLREELGKILEFADTYAVNPEARSFVDSLAILSAREHVKDMKDTDIASRPAYKFLENTPPGAIILDLASGINMATFMQNLKKDVSYILVDKSPFVKTYLQEVARLFNVNNVTILDQDVLQLAMPGQHFDVIRAKNVPHYVPGFVEKLREMKEWVKIGGQIIIQNDPNWAQRMHAAADYGKFAEELINQGWSFSFKLGQFESYEYNGRTMHDSVLDSLIFTKTEDRSRQSIKTSLKAWVDYLKANVEELLSNINPQISSMTIKPISLELPKQPVVMINEDSLTTTKHLFDKSKIINIDPSLFRDLYRPRLNYADLSYADMDPEVYGEEEGIAMHKNRERFIFTRLGEFLIINEKGIARTMKEEEINDFRKKIEEQRENHTNNLVLKELYNKFIDMQKTIKRTSGSPLITKSDVYNIMNNIIATAEQNPGARITFNTYRFGANTLTQWLAQAGFQNVSISPQLASKHSSILTLFFLSIPNMHKDKRVSTFSLENDTLVWIKDGNDLFIVTEQEAVDGGVISKVSSSPLKTAFARRLKDLGIASLGILMWVTAAGAQDNTLVPSAQQNQYVLNTNYSDTLNGTYANVDLELGKHLILTVGALKGAEESGPYGPYAGFTFNTVESSQDFFMKGGFEISMFNYQNEIAQQNSSNWFVGSANYAVAELFPLTKTVDITVGGAASVSGSYTNSGNDISENWRFFSPPTLAGKILLGWNISPDKRVTLGLDTTAYNEFTNVQSYSMAFFPYSKLRLGYSTICLLGVPTNFGASYGEGPGYGRIFSIDTKGSPTPGTDVAVEYQQADKPTYVIFPEGRKIGLTVDKQLTSREGGPRFSLTASVEKLIYEWGGHSQTNSTVGFKLIIPFQPTRNLGAGMSVEKEVGTPFVANNYKIIPFESPADFSFDELKQALETMSPDEFVNNFLRNRTKVKNLNDLLQSVAYITDQLGTYNWSEKSDPLFKGVNMLNITDAQMLSTLGESLRTGEPIPAVVCAGIFSAGSDWINAARLPGVFAFQASVEAGHPQGGHIITVVVTPKTIYLVDYFQYKIIDTGTRNSAEALALYERIQQNGDAALTHEIFHGRKFIGFAGGPFDDNYGSRDGELLRNALTIDGGKSADKLLEDAVKAVQPSLTVPEQPKATEPSPNINPAPIPEAHMLAKSASSAMNKDITNRISILNDPDRYGRKRGNLSETESMYQALLSKSLESEGFSSGQAKTFSLALIRFYQGTLNNLVEDGFLSRQDKEDLIELKEFNLNRFRTKMQENYEAYKNYTGKGGKFAESQISYLLFAKLFSFQRAKGLIDEEGLSRNNISIIVRYANPEKWWQEKKIFRDRLVNEKKLELGYATRIVLEHPEDPWAWWASAEVTRDRLVAVEHLNLTQANWIVVQYSNPMEWWQKIKTIRDRLVEGTVTKTSLSGVDLIRDTILNPNNITKDSIWEEVSSTEVRLKPNIDLEHIVSEIAKGDFDKVWPILQQVLREGKISIEDATMIVLQHPKDPWAWWEKVKPVRKNLIEKEHLSPSDATRVIITHPQDPMKWWITKAKPFVNKLMEDGLKEYESKQMVLQHSRDPLKRWEEAKAVLKELVEQEGLSKSTAKEIINQHSYPKTLWYIVKKTREELINLNPSLRKREKGLAIEFIKKDPNRFQGKDFGITDEQLEIVLKPLKEFKNKESSGSSPINDLLPTEEKLGIAKPGGIDLSKIELTLKDEKYISSLSPADVKVLRAAKALKDGWNSLSLLYAHEVMLMLEDKVVLSIKNKPMLQEVLNQLNSRECLDPQGLIFLQAMQSRLATPGLAVVKP